MKPSVELRIDTFSDTLGERLTNGTRPPPGELRLHWLGQAGFVIESHLLRFAFREEPDPLAWQPAG